MKKLIIIIPFLFVYKFTNAQCNCQKIIKEDVTLLQCPANIVSYDNTTAVGLSAGKAKGELYINLTVRFKESAKEINSKLTLWLTDGNSISLELFNGGLAYIGNSEVAHGIYKINDSQLKKIKESNIKTIAFTLTDGLRRTYTAKSNANILVTHLKCLL